MKTFVKLVPLLLLLLTGICRASDVTCHLIENKSKGKYYKTCDNKSIEIKFHYNFFVFGLSEDDIPRSTAIMWYTPKDSRMGDERWFIFDYKSMAIYDNKCLGGNFIMIDGNKDIVFSRYEDETEGKLTVFNPQNFEHCKQYLSKWKPRD